MNTIHKTLSTLILLALSGISLAQAPVVRQPPPQPAPPPASDQQQTDQYQPPMPPPPPDAQQPTIPPMAPQQLDQLVQRIALYPDPLLAQVLTASTFWDQIPDAATWSQQHSNLIGDALPQAIQADNLPWDPSVLALLPFPTVLDMMARDPQWTGTLGNAVLSQRSDVMDAVQRQRHIARDYGYLTPTAYDAVVDNGGYIEIQPVNPAYYYVPIYSPAVVFFAPRPGFVVGGAIRFRPVVTIGPSFGVFGWYGAGFGWGTHAILIDHRPWGRTFYNRNVYVHAYAHPYVRPATQRVEVHPHSNNEHPHNSEHRN
jgi:hypothetical protein